MNSAGRLSCIALIAFGGSASAQKPAAHPTADPVIPALPAGTPRWEQPPEWSAEARAWWREQLGRATVVVGDRSAGRRLRGPTFGNALPIEAAAGVRLLDDTTHVRFVLFNWNRTLPLGPVVPPPTPAFEHFVEGVTVALSARPVEVRAGDGVRFLTTARNATGQSVKIAEQCGPPMDVVITGPNGYRVWLLAEMLGPHGDFTCEIRRSHFAGAAGVTRQRLAWRAPRVRGDYTAVSGLRGVYRLKQLSAPVRMRVR